MPDESTREELATLRERITNTLHWLEEVAVEMKDDRDEFHKAVRDLQGEITRYKGFVGGIAFILSGVVTALTLFKGWIFGEHK